jgi:hypothetical protein
VIKEILIKGKRIYRNALQRYEMARGRGHTSTLTIVHILSQLYKDRGKLVEMIKLVSIWGSQSVDLFGDLGRTLLQILDDSNAQIAFQQQIESQDKQMRLSYEVLVLRSHIVLHRVVHRSSVPNGS